MNIYLPRACATLLRPSATAAPNTLQLKFPRHFSKIDIRSYLKAVYEVDVANVGYTNEGSDAVMFTYVTIHCE